MCVCVCVCDVRPIFTSRDFCFAAAAFLLLFLLLNKGDERLREDAQLVAANYCFKDWALSVAHPGLGGFGHW